MVAFDGTMVGCAPEDSRGRLGTRPAGGRDRASRRVKELQQEHAIPQPPPSAEAARARIPGVRVLVVEDDADVGDTVRRGLEETGILAEWAQDAAAAFLATEQGAFDVLVLDVMLGRGIDGFELCRALRGRGVPSAILMLTARDAVSDRVRGLEAGADDYLVKPFAFQELLARIRALVRRPAFWAPDAADIGGLRVDAAARRVSLNGDEVSLSRREFDVLDLLIRHPGRTFTKDQIETQVWGFGAESSGNLVEVYVGRLRRKLNDPGGARFIATIRGVGYRFEPAPA
jgi:two-component system OmpR family response regulator